MTQVGSLINHLATNHPNAPVVPVVGMGATEIAWSDRHAFTIIEVKSANKIVVQRDKATRSDNNGMSDEQSFEYEADPKGGTIVLKLRKNGKWIPEGQPMNGGTVYLLGTRMEYYDYSF